MHVLLFGLSHEVAPVALRERVAFSGTGAADVLADILACDEVTEAAILSTCNRSEIYVVSDEPASSRESLIGMLSARCKLEASEIAQSFAWREDEGAVSHLLRVAAGLESQILGEGQILGQVRDAAKLARDNGALGPVLEALFRQAQGCGKRVRTETSISQGAVSVGSAAVELAAERLGGFADRSVLLVGAGKIGELALRHLAAQGVRQIMVTNRTLESAQDLARVVGGKAIPFTSLHEALGEVDLVLCCTGAPHYILGASDLHRVMGARGGRPMLLVDVSVPRNIDPAVASIPGVSLCDMDHLTTIAQRNRAERAFLVPQAELILAEELAGWHSFLRSYEAAPTITGLREKFEALRLVELDAFLKDNADLAPETLAAIEQLTRRLTNKFLHEPTVGLRQKGDSQQGSHAAAIRELFGLAAPARRPRRPRIAKL